jgi:hypothetical protein
MHTIHKLIHGYVKQSFDAITLKFQHQEFIETGEIIYADENDEYVADPPNIKDIPIHLR